MARNDPVMKAHAFQVQVRPFDVFWTNNKFSPGAEVCAEEKMPQPK
jgi:hypothetical protein